MNPLKLVLAGLVSSAMAFLSPVLSPTIVQQAAPLAAKMSVPLPGVSSCADNTVVIVPGGGNTTDFLPPEVPAGNYTMQVGQMLRAPGKVSDRYVSYDTIPGVAASYDQRVEKGYEAARKIIETDAANCPNTTFSLYGYSMGADVASRIVGDIAYGNGPISRDRFAGAAFLANPRRANDGRVLQTGGARNVAGAFPAYRGGYGDLGNRVLEICRSGDITCDTPNIAAPLAKAFAETTVLTGMNGLRELERSVASMPLPDQAQFFATLPSVIPGARIHNDYNAINAVNVSVDHLRSFFK